MSRKYRVVIDTNVLLVSISDRSAFHWLFQALLQNRLDCFVTTEILAEYEEIIGLKWSDSIAKSTIRALLELPNVYLSVSHFKYDLLRDLDDNKFPFTGTGKPEPLKHDLSGCWSRRINGEHRLIYEVSGDTIFSLSAKGHYKKIPSRQLSLPFHHPAFHSIDSGYF